MKPIRITNQKLFAGVVIIQAFVLAGYFLSSCSSKGDPTPSKITYEANIKPLISLRCSPCHLPPNGFEVFFDSYSATKSNIDEMIRRIQLPRTDTTAMPFKLGKLSDAEIQKFIQWKDDGLLK